MRLRTAALLGALTLSTATLHADSAQSPVPTPSPSLAVGHVLPPFEATGVDGSVKEVKYPQGVTTVLVFFLSSCPVCHQMLPEWSRAYERKPAHLEVVGVLLDREPPGFFAVTPVPFPVVRAPSREFSRIFKIERVPMTLRVAPGGKVENVAQGVVDPIRLGEFFRP